MEPPLGIAHFSSHHAGRPLLAVLLTSEVRWGGLAPAQSWVLTPEPTPVALVFWTDTRPRTCRLAHLGRVWGAGWDSGGLAHAVTTSLPPRPELSLDSTRGPQSPG